ncbi:hypothetical protein FF38_01882 [Lucilia cuprina]|uniref:Regulatory protein zeste n=1 Tax=Lucilia cuprina TaxID=7375 RepID=A0A0L0BSJ9_LUCCU|nr:hypothetical protein FF38_01882 [Lucilia cuprina]
MSERWKKQQQEEQKSKTTNKAQIQQLVTLMEGNPDIACGFHKGSKVVLARFWRNDENELNSMGPPTKCVAESKMAAQNLKYKKGTGGGPNKEQSFSPTEEAIYNLISMKSSVECVPMKPIGLTDAPLIEKDESLDIQQENVVTIEKTSPAVERNRKKTAHSQKEPLKNSCDAPTKGYIDR